MFFRHARIPVDQLMSLAYNAECCGFGDDLFYVSLFGWMFPLSDAEIDQYTNSLGYNYDPDEREDIREFFHRMRDKYQPRSTVPETEHDIPELPPPVSE